MPNRNASSTITGFEYQVNVAIYFMFKCLKEISSINFEGEKEDVEINFNNSKRMMIQSKAQTRDLNDERNNISKLNHSLISLAEADEEDVQQLCYVSNMSNPLKTTSKEFDYPGITFKYYDELSEAYDGLTKLYDLVKSNSSKVNYVDEINSEYDKVKNKLIKAIDFVNNCSNNMRGLLNEEKL